MNISKFKPTGKRVLVKRRDVTEAHTESGIVLSTDPNAEKERSHDGCVIAVGSSEFSVGDNVYFLDRAGYDLDEDHVLLRDEDILAIIR